MFQLLHSDYLQQLTLLSDLAVLQSSLLQEVMLNHDSSKPGEGFVHIIMKVFGVRKTMYNFTSLERKLNASQSTEEVGYLYTLQYNMLGKHCIISCNVN